VADPQPSLSGVLETVLYCAPGERESVERFYSELLGLAEVSRFDDGTAFRLGGGVLLIFDLERLGRRQDPIAEHGSAGPGHTCLLARRPGEYGAWRDRIEAAGIEITHEHEWRDGMRSFYFRDPAGNLLEIASDDIWPPA